MAPTTQPPSPPPTQHQQQLPKPESDPHDEMPTPSELYKIGVKSLQTGGILGACGFVFGNAFGIMRSAPPILFGLFASLQWFALGSSFTSIRCLLWHAWGGEENLKPGEKVLASTIAGAGSGMTGGLIRGPTNIIPGIFVFSALGGGSTYVANRIQERQRLAREQNKPPFWPAFWKKWSPLQAIDDKEYEKILEEKILRLDAQIAVIDDHLTALKGYNQPHAQSKEGSSDPKKQ